MKQQHMKYDPLKHHRHSIRLKGYDYTQPGAYFVTICVQNRKCLLGDIADGEMRSNDIGAMVQAEWLKLPQRSPHITLDAFIVMPNHIHGIIFIGARGASTRDAPTATTTATTATPAQPITPEGASVRAGLVPALSMDETIIGASTRDAPMAMPANSIRALGDIIGAYKSITTHEYVLGVRNLGWKPFPGRFWQRNYYEHIVRGEADLARIRAYIRINPARWTLDQLRPTARPNRFNQDQL